MKMLKIYCVIACLLYVLPMGQVWAKKATSEESRIVAENWIKTVIAKKGAWGEHEGAQVTEIVPFGRKGKQLGYFCKVEPKGYIVVSLHKGLAPVKVYSATSDIDPAGEEGMSDLIKLKMERVVRDVEKLTAKKIDDVSEELMEQALESGHGQSWKKLTKKDMVVEADAADGSDGADATVMYVPGTEMLKTYWHQQPPYNNQCPDDGCSWEGYDYWNSRVRVGCVATAGAQILRYWNWPPYGSDGQIIPWRDMREQYWYFYNQTTGARGFSTEKGIATTGELDAVAWLCHRVGVAVDMDYGCDASGADTYDMEGVFQGNYYYSNSCSVTYRDDHTQNGWWSMLVNQFNANRPVLCRVEEHAIVLDGHQILTGAIRQYHTNYGWGGQAWYTLDELHLGGVSEEYVLKDIVPNVALDYTLEGTYAWSLWPYYYFDKDAHGDDAQFEAGLKLQMLNPGLVIEGRGTGDEWVSFAGSNEMDPQLGIFQLHTVFFYHGDEEGKERIKIHDGQIRLQNYGQIVFLQ